MKRFFFFYGNILNFDTYDGGVKRETYVSVRYFFSRCNLIFGQTTRAILIAQRVVAAVHFSYVQSTEFRAEAPAAHKLYTVHARRR